MRELIALPAAAGGGNDAEGQLIALVLDGVTSEHSRRSYRTGLVRFFAWVRSTSAPGFSKAVVQEYRATLVAEGLSPASINLRLSPLRKLARELADNGHIEEHAAAAIGRVPGVESRGTRVGNWLLKEQANALLSAPNPSTLAGKRDRAILGLLLGCGLRRSELIRIEISDLQQREGRWVLPDMLGKGNRLRTVTVPPWVKVAVDAWLDAAGLRSGRLFRPIGKGGRITGEEIRDEKAVWRVVARYSQTAKLGKLAPHDLRRTCAKLCRKAGGPIEQIQILLGHASVQTTERYLGTEQNFSQAVNDSLGLGWN